MISDRRGAVYMVCKKDESMGNTEKEIDTQIIRNILSRGNNAEVKRNKDGEIIILEVEKRIAKK